MTTRKWYSNILFTLYIATRINLQIGIPRTFWCPCDQLRLLETSESKLPGLFGCPGPIKN